MINRSVIQLVKRVYYPLLTKIYQKQRLRESTKMRYIDYSQQKRIYKKYNQENGRKLVLVQYSSIGLKRIRKM